MQCRGMGVVEGVKEVTVTIPAGWSSPLGFVYHVRFCLK